MISILRHRGPDETGIYLDHHIGLGHARLSIIDLNDGTQPIANEDETLWIIFNGEIFNYIELRAELIKQGHRFSTDTDTEVILHLYEELGADCLHRLNGQFALAIWDTRQKKLFLARDRVGIRPLFTTVQNGRLLFASEIKALLTDPAIRPGIDMTSLQQIFTCWAPIGHRTIFRDVFELPPGHYQVIDMTDGPQQPIPFWEIPYYEGNRKWQGTREEAVEELQHLMRDAVRLRLRADVPVGAYLSGGLDSSILTRIISSEFNNRLKTFSIGFEEKAFDESLHQKEMVDFLGTDHQQTSVSNRLVREHFADVVWHCEKPLLRTGPVPLYLLSGLVRAHDFKVVLTGEGADEIFCGYNIFKEAKVRQFMGRDPDSAMRGKLVERLYPYIFQDNDQARIFLRQFFGAGSNDNLEPLFSHRKRWESTGKSRMFFNRDALSGQSDTDPLQDILDRLPGDFGDRDLFSRAQWLEMNIFLSNYLLSSQGDRVAMAHSVELRLPYLDYRVIDFAARLPAHWKMPGLKEKHLLKQAYRGHLPASIVNRPKQPYRSPIGPAFFANEKNNDPEELICFDQVERAGIFNRKKVEGLFDKQRKSADARISEMQNMAVVGIISTQLIYEQYIENFKGRNVTPVRPDKIVRKTRRTDRQAVEPVIAGGRA